MLLLTCPNCGPRNAAEFRHGGEVHARPGPDAEVTEAAWTDFLYMKDNVSAMQTEWWYHRAGCGQWFLAERHNYTNEVARTYMWAPKSQAGEPSRGN
jgi:sarcosine oxidase, subunit delta